MIPIIKNNGNKIAAITGKITSFLAKNADFILNSQVENEGCLNNFVESISEINNKI